MNDQSPPVSLRAIRAAGQTLQQEAAEFDRFLSDLADDTDALRILVLYLGRELARRGPVDPTFAIVMDNCFKLVSPSPELRRQGEAEKDEARRRGEERWAEIIASLYARTAPAVGRS